MTWKWPESRRATFALAALGVLLSFGCVACRIRSNGPHWIETHGNAQVQRVAGGPMGLLAIGTNGLIYNYPEFGSVWHEWNGRLHPRVVTGSRQGIVYADQENRVGKGSRGHVSNPEWTLGSPVSALATDESGHTLYAVSDEGVSRLDPGGVVPGPCNPMRVVSVALAQDALWLSDGQQVYIGSDTACQPAPGAPARVTRLAGLGQRLFAVDAAGDVFRKNQGNGWEQLPRPLKFRPDQLPKFHPALDVAVTGTAAWLVDDESNVFVLSESE